MIGVKPTYELLSESSIHTVMVAVADKWKFPNIFGNRAFYLVSVITFKIFQLIVNAARSLLP